MTQEEFDKAPLLDQILYDTTGMLVENHKGIAEAMEKYHKTKVKNLGLLSVSQQRELLIDFFKFFRRQRLGRYNHNTLNEDLVDNYLKSINCG